MKNLVYFYFCKIPNHSNFQLFTTKYFCDEFIF